MDRLNIFADYHTHTVYSHGKGSIEDNVKAAIKKGLSKIGISDHGYKHMGFGVKYRDFEKMRREIDMLNERYDEIEILLGVEANILDDDGNIDVDEKIISTVDYVMAGYHFGSTPTKILKGSLNHMCNYIKPLHSLAMEYNTRAVINAMKKNDIFIITHPGAKGPIEFEMVAKSAEETNTALEINSSHGHLTYEEIMMVKDTGVKFAIGSDAHSPEHVGDFDDALARVRKAGLQIEQIINARR